MDWDGNRCNFLDADQQNVCLSRNQKKAYKYYGTVLSYSIYNMNVCAAFGVTATDRYG